MALATTAHERKFQRCLERTLRYLLSLVATVEPLPDEATRILAMHTLSYAFGAPALWPLTRQLVLTLAPKMEQTGHRGDWLVYLEQATAFSEQAADWAAAAECYLQRGLLHRLLSEFPLAIDQLEQSVTLCQQIGDQRTAARALNELAWVAYLQNRTTPATAYVEQARALLTADDPEQAMCDRVQGMLAIAHERWGEAEEWHRQALAIFEAQGDQRKTAWSLQNLAYALRGQGRYVEAISYYERAEKILWELRDKFSLAVVFFNLGIAWYQLRDVDKAMGYYNDARTVFKELNNKLYLARIHTDIGLALLTGLRYVEAEAAFLTSIRLFRELGDDAWRLNAMDGLAMLYLAQQAYANAVAVLEDALLVLPRITTAANYNYLQHSLNLHLQDALAKQGAGT